MMNKLIIDTNLIVGLYDKKDVWHRQAKSIMEDLVHRDLDLILLDCVVNETFTVLARRLRERKSHDILLTTLKKVKAGLPQEKITQSYALLPTHYDEVVDRVIQSQGRINFHDALIITFAISQSISNILSFDENFDGINGIVRVSNLS